MGFWQFATGGGSGGGTGDVVGPASSTDNAIARFDGATGKLIQNSGVTVADGLTGGVIVGSTGATDNAILIANGTGGSTLEASTLTIDTNPILYFPNTVSAGIVGSGSLYLGASSFFRFRIESDKLKLASNIPIVWASGTDLASDSPDTGLARSAAGVVKVTDGSTGIRGLLGGGTAVASATAMPLPTGRVFHVTGTTAITSITSTNFQAGAVITLIFDDVLTFTDGNNLKLAGDFTTSADDTITLAYDGSNWYECSRSVN